MGDPAFLPRCLSEFLNCYASKMKEVSSETNLPFQMSLIVDNALRHPPGIDDLPLNNKVGFLPPNTTSLIQPTGQGVTAAFQASCLRRTCAQAIATTEEDADAVLEGLQCL